MKPKIFPLTGSKIADLIILAIIGYIIYGFIAFGVPDMGSGTPNEADEIDWIELF